MKYAKLFIPRAVSLYSETPNFEIIDIHKLIG